ncbi:hypothetical protein [Trueperella pecoris]|uniref:hypothetical protein n=1 Tax=Trueperella pecoris TaxID=2733571 RepID=UPI00186B9C5F|nr:hypothetical protein [Trueperella pecoris]QOQ39539.1 hypothetical protein HLG82_08875 [Trueperella pecoris]
MDGYVKINNADDHKAMLELVTYVNSGLCFAPQYTNCNQQYYWHQRANSQRVAFPAYQRVAATTSLSPNADYARARIRVVIDIPYRNDIVSNDVLTRGEKY